MLLNLIILIKIRILNVDMIKEEKKTKQFFLLASDYSY